ncbi:MAG: DUF4357 domain-containing protein [Prevotella sp.]|nr:DUF4357 domain-containing protein [Prevotella sp.]
MTEDGWNINEKYEELFGSAKRVNLFDTEDEYMSLRRYIVEQPIEIYHSSRLPFETIDLSIQYNKKEIPRKEIASIIQALQMQHIKLKKSSWADSSKHLFYIEVVGECNAAGYFEKETGYFYVCKNSLVAYDTDILYLASDTEKARVNFLKKACKEEHGYFRVMKDAKCRSASAAACYVMGRQADSTNWKDLQGNTISEVYPRFSLSPIPNNEKPTKEDISSQKCVKVTKIGRSPRYYYISRDMGNRSCKAKGMYDKVNDKFIILEGSVLAYEVTSSYRYTSSDIKRNKFIQQNCKSKYENKLKRDAICNSPDEAACFVLGEKANGWTEWKSKDGISLDSYINKV